MNKCLNCNKETKNPKFCSKSCSASYNNKGVRRHGKSRSNCLWCGKTLSRISSIYCDIDCYHQYFYHIRLNKWKIGIDTGVRKGNLVASFIRRYLFEKYNNKCQKCGWSIIHPKTNKVPLTIHHIDGDCINNKENNLELLCPNCHSLTDTYGALNCNNSIKRKDTYR